VASRLQAALYDWALAPTEEASFGPWRSELLGSLQGTVLEIGAGTGVNLQHYGDGIERLVVTEPSGPMRAQISAKLGDRTNVEITDASALDLPFDAGTFDVVVCTLVLCSVPDVDAVLAEVLRVLKPGGRFVFMEHVAAEDKPGRLVWQKRIEPVWKIIADGCHLTRRTADHIAAAGFTFERLDRASARKAMPVVRPMVLGVAIAPS
jgi:ubiquinone/menaquinone biosynthesis C-methylase UbiE